MSSKLTQERRARLAIERQLELKEAELTAANRKLGLRAEELAKEVLTRRAEMENIRDENLRVRSDLSEAHEKIARVERQLWQSIQTISDGFALFNPDNELIMANNAYLAIFDGLEEVKPGVNYMTILQLMTDEGIIDTGGVRPEDWRRFMFERICQPEPQPLVMRLWNGGYARIMDQRGADGDLATLATDITETVRNEKALKEARAFAEDANRAKSVFLANMSHEIRTPMNGVVGMTDVLAETSLSDEQRLYVDTIKSSGEALLVIINDVLDYSKIEANKLQLINQPFDLEKAIQEVLLLLRPAAQEKGLSLVLDYDLFLPPELVGDVGRIRQVVTNLLSNAVKFTQQGHVVVRIKGSVDELTEEILLHVSIEDTGIGIPNDQISRIFGVYDQVKNDRNLQYDGTGLGLAISQRLIKLMGGEISVTSEEGVGSCFEFSIPLRAAADAPDYLPELPDLLRKIMIVDTLDVNRSVLGQQLEQLGIGVISCADGHAAIAALSSDIDLIITDHDMTELDGMALTHEIRTAGFQMPIILLSADPKRAHAHPAFRDLLTVLRKPLPRKELLKQLEALGPSLCKTAQRHGVDGARQMRILAADDNKTNQLVFAQMLKSIDVDVRFAKNGQEAVAQFETYKPDLIFMDISMPVMDGKEATAAIRALEFGTDAHVPIVALTANVLENDTQNALEVGMDHYLTKPLRKPTLLAQIASAQPVDTLPLVSPAQPAAG